MFIAAIATIGSAVIGGSLAANASKKAGNTAAAAQTQAADQSMAEQRRQFDAIQSMFRPYVEAGGGALARQLDLMGNNGPEAQQRAIQAIEMGPEFQALTRQGEEAILQSASATGGLRGGNVQASLAKFRPEVLSSLINQQYQRLGGLTQMGQASAGMQAANGQSFANNASNLFMQSGDARANAALARGQADANMWGNIAGSVGFAAGRGLFWGGQPNYGGFAPTTDIGLGMASGGAGRTGGLGGLF
jgi:hypothetical protein